MRSFTGVSNPFKLSEFWGKGKYMSTSLQMWLWRPLSCCPQHAIINGITGMQG